MSASFTASCLCGGVKLSYSGELGPANYCHCADCRRITGSAFNIGLRVYRKDLVVNATSELRSYNSANAAGRKIERYFCATCGSPIFTLHPSKPEFAWVKAGIIDQPELVQPEYENWIKDKVSWATITVIESYAENKPLTESARPCD